jgi:hypothetical protein
MQPPAHMFLAFLVPRCTRATVEPSDVGRDKKRRNGNADSKKSQSNPARRSSCRDDFVPQRVQTKVIAVELMRKLIKIAYVLGSVEVLWRRRAPLRGCVPKGGCLSGVPLLAGAVIHGAHKGRDQADRKAAFLELVLGQPWRSSTPLRTCPMQDRPPRALGRPPLKKTIDRHYAAALRISIAEGRKLRDRFSAR